MTANNKLTERQRKFLRKAAHPLKPLLSMGDKGLTDAFLQELHATLEHHELIKVRVKSGDREAREEVIAAMLSHCHALLVSRVGHVATLYRPRKKDPKIVLPA